MHSKGRKPVHLQVNFEDFEWLKNVILDENISNK